MYENPLIMKAGPVPNIAIKKPAIAGPASLPKLKLTEFKLMAFGMSFKPTNSET
jgi:hypothetical protein